MPSTVEAAGGNARPRQREVIVVVLCSALLVRLCIGLHPYSGV